MDHQTILPHQVVFSPLEPLQMPLVKPFYKAHYPSGRPNKSEKIIVGYLGKELVASVRFKPISPYWLLTGMLVSPEFRGLNIGHQLLNYCQQNILAAHYYCFAYQHLHSFYQQHHFISCTESEIPPILATRFSNYQSKGKNLVAMKYQSNL